MQSLAQEWVVAEQALIVLELRSSHRARSRHLIVHVRLEQTFRHRHLSLARLIIEAHVPGVGIMSSDFSEVAHCSAAGKALPPSSRCSYLAIWHSNWRLHAPAWPEHSLSHGGDRAGDERSYGSPRCLWPEVQVLGGVQLTYFRKRLHGHDLLSV